MRDDTTFNAFVNWVKTKRDADTYEFLDTRNCAYAQFLKETDRCPDPSVGGWDWHPRNDYTVTKIDERLIGVGSERTPLAARSFGGILQRLTENGHVE